MRRRGTSDQVRHTAIATCLAFGCVLIAGCGGSSSQSSAAASSSPTAAPPDLLQSTTDFRPLTAGVTYRASGFSPSILLRVNASDWWGSQFDTGPRIPAAQLASHYDATQNTVQGLLTIFSMGTTTPDAALSAMATTANLHASQTGALTMGSYSGRGFDCQTTGVAAFDSLKFKLPPGENCTVLAFTVRGTTLVAILDGPTANYAAFQPAAEAIVGDLRFPS